MRKIFYSITLGLALLAGLFSVMPAAAQGPVSLPDVPGYYWWTQTIPQEYVVTIANYSPQNVVCDSFGCSGTLLRSGFFGEQFRMIISKTDDLDDYMHVFDITFADQSVESGQYGAGYLLNGVPEGFFQFSPTVPEQTYRFCKYDTTLDTGTPQVAIDWADENCDVLHGDGPAISGAWITFEAAWQNSPFDFVIDIDWIGILRLEEEPVLMPFPPYCYITITDTVTITDSFGITSTEVITIDYQAESNLVQNYSFEEGGSTPDDWQPVIGGVVSVIPPFYQPNTPQLARTGSDSIYNGGSFELWNDLPLVEGGTFLGGFHARCVTGDCAGSVVDARWNASPLATATNITTSYTIYSGTQATGGGASWFILSFPEGEGDVHVDDAFVYPIDENGDLLCDPLYYPPPEIPEEEDPPVAGIVPNVSEACWDCQTPDNWFSIGLWIRWLGCKLHNLFWCALYIWLLNIANWINGVWLKLVALLAWLPTAGQQFLIWGANAINNVLAWLGNLWDVVRTQVATVYRSLIQSIFNSAFIQTIWGWFSWIGALWDVVKLLFSALLEIIHRIYLALVELVRFLVETFLALRDILSTDAWRIHVITQQGQEVDTIAPGDLYADGPNATKILWLFLSGIGAIDYIVGMFSQMEFILVAVVGVMAIGVFMWTARIWHDILPT